MATLFGEPNFETFLGDQLPILRKRYQAIVKFNSSLEKSWNLSLLESGNLVNDVAVVKLLSRVTNYNLPCELKFVSKICGLNFEIVAITRPCIRFFSIR